MRKKEPPPARSAMKRRVCGFSMLILCSLGSCASRQPALIPAPPPLAPSPIAPSHEETGLPPASPPARPVPEKPTDLERVVQWVKQQSPIIKKYILQEGDRIQVKSDLGQEDLPELAGDTRFEVDYDLAHARQIDGDRFWVDFSVQEASSGSIRRDSLLWHIKEDAVGLLLAFDDNYQDAWEGHLDLFDRYGAKVTFFIQGDLCSFCFTALSRGHDVGYHTRHHLNLTKVSREVFFTETLSAIDTFRNAGIPLHAFAYPYGLWEPWMHEELAPAFKILRGYGVTFRVYDRESIAQGYISSKALDNILYKEDADFQAIITLMLRTLKFIGGELILPLTTHDISDRADWGITPQRLNYLLQSAQDLHLRFYRYRDF